MNQFEWVDPKETLARNLRDAGIDYENPTIQRFAELWLRIQDLPRHLGQHSGGMVICQGRLDEIVPLENASMPDRVVIQWDKDDCADMGLVKVDLGLGMMAVLQDALALVNGASSPPSAARRSGIPRTGGLPIPGMRAASRGRRSWTSPTCRPTIDGVRMLQEADTIGIFQVESRAQMATLPRLKPARFYDIVVEVAIIRPGPIVGQMVHPSSLKRRQGLEPMTPSTRRSRILARTLGVPLFSGAAAAHGHGRRRLLRRRSGSRRAFGFKRSEKRMQQIEEKLRAGMARQGITGGAADEIIRSITSFALYGFPESHAASFALLVYAKRVSQGALSVGVLHGDAEQPADGVLPSRYAREGRAAARRPLRADRRAGIRLGVPRRCRWPRRLGLMPSTACARRRREDCRGPPPTAAVIIGATPGAAALSQVRLRR